MCLHCSPVIIIWLDRICLIRKLSSWFYSVAGFFFPFLFGILLESLTEFPWVDWNILYKIHNPHIALWQQHQRCAFFCMQFPTANVISGRNIMCKNEIWIMIEMKLCYLRITFFYSCSFVRLKWNGLSVRYGLML